MKSEARSFIIFQLVFWLVAGTALLLSGLSQMNPLEAIVRNIYLPLVGFLATFFLVFFYRRFLIGKVRQIIWPVLAVSWLVGAFCAVVVNPITYSQQGVPFADLDFAAMLSGALNFALVLALWSVLYLSLSGVPLLPGDKQGDKPSTLLVDDGGNQVYLQVADIIFARSSGDYIELVTSERTWLRRGYLRDLEGQLDSNQFQRIHRSLLVNCDSIQTISKLGKGRVAFQMATGETLNSSRGYLDAIEARFNLA